MKTRFTKLLIAAAAFAMPSSAWAACTVSDTGPTSLGSYPSATIQTTVTVPTNGTVYAQVPAGFDCADALLSILSGDSLSVTATSATGFLLTSTTSKTHTAASYVLAADRANTKPIAPSTKFYYLNGTLINLLGLLGNSVRNIQIYVKPSSVDELEPGKYTGDFQLAWQWKLCTVAVAVCLGSTSGTATAKVSVTMEVQPKPVGVVITTRTTWDPQASTVNPHAIPGSKQRTTVTLMNPNSVGIDANTLAVVLPTPARGAVALDGDGTTSTAYVATLEGSPASSLGVTYTAPGSLSDDIDFSSDNGATWTYDPTATPKAVNSVRIRPHGTMAAGSSFSVSIPYALF